MKTETKWLRCNRANPCRICEKSDWCGYSDDGAAICMRVESATSAKNGGWLHVERGTRPRATQPRRASASVARTSAAPPAAPAIDAAALMDGFSADTTNEMLCGLAHALGVECGALKLLGAAWAGPHRAWAFPMCNGVGKVIGIRLRADDGRKWAVTGSRQGIFVPAIELLPRSFDFKTAFICEGVSDTAAALSMGLFSFGRPSCTGGTEQIVDFMKLCGTRRAVIVADNDSPGQRGAVKLADEIGTPSCIYTPPCKDMREFYQFGGTAELIREALKDIVWRVPMQREKP